MPLWLALLIIGILLVVAAKYWIGDPQFARWAYGGGVFCIIVAVILFIVGLLGLASPTLHAAALSPLAIGGAGFMLGALDTNVHTEQPTSGGGQSYPLAYAAAWIVAAVGIIAGGVAAAGLTVHPSWLTSDVTATASIVAPICVALGAILPQIQRTPGKRESSYLLANQGQLPPDLQAKYPTITTVQEPTLPRT
jgi:hypothetical protein